MAICEEQWRKRTDLHQRRCGALAVEGFSMCSAHLSARGYKRCPTCETWVQPVGNAFVCPKCAAIFHP